MTATSARTQRPARFSVAGRLRKRRIKRLLGRIRPADTLTLDEYERVCEAVGVDPDQALTGGENLERLATLEIDAPGRFQPVLDAIAPGSGVDLRAERVGDGRIILEAALATFVYASAQR